MTIIQGKNSKLKGEKLKTQAKNSRFRQNQKRGLPKVGRKKKAALNLDAGPMLILHKINHCTVDLGFYTPLVKEVRILFKLKLHFT